MKKPAAGARPKAGAKQLPAVRSGKIHPVIIYPFKQSGEYSDLLALYELIARLDTEKDKYARPITVIDRKTVAAMEGNSVFHDFCKNTVSRYSELLDAWCVDTCQMWYSGLGMAFDQGGPDDVYWLSPGDFNYGSATGKEVLSRLHDLPEICIELQQDICIGEIATDHAHPKELIDSYGTFALLYNWFPNEAQEVRSYTERPRSEFFAVRHAFLGEALRQRWYAYEQTMVMLLQAIFAGKHIARFDVGHICDLPEGRESLASVMQQVERTERVLKTLWRERHATMSGWLEQYRLLESQSDQVRRTALITLQSLLS
jgi:hypothetical protein